MDTVRTRMEIKGKKEEGPSEMAVKKGGER
jgi:hypothetical protein